jgi:hypothetical protein
MGYTRLFPPHQTRAVAWRHYERPEAEPFAQCLHTMLGGANFRRKLQGLTTLVSKQV